MSGNTATVVAGLAGILVSIICSYVFYWLGGRDSHRQNSELMQEVAELRTLLSSFVQGIADRLPAAHALIKTAGGDKGVDPSVANLPKEATDIAMEELIRASLGALLNERGEVDMTRLLREVGGAVGPRHMAEAVAVLRRLRDQGVVSWGDAEDLSQVRTVRVHIIQRPDASAPPGSDDVG